MEDKSPAMINKDFREGSFRGVCVRRGRSQRRKVRSSLSESTKTSQKKSAERLAAWLLALLSRSAHGALLSRSAHGVSKVEVL